MGYLIASSPIYPLLFSIRSDNFNLCMKTKELPTAVTAYVFPAVLLCQPTSLALQVLLIQGSNKVARPTQLYCCLAFQKLSVFV